MRAQQFFVAEASSVAEARRFARRTLEEWGEDELVDSASLIVSELVTNAVVHTGTTARLTLRSAGASLRIDVEDQHPGRKLPIVTEPPPDTSEHGRGLVDHDVALLRLGRGVHRDHASGSGPSVEQEGTSAARDAAPGACPAPRRATHVARRRRSRWTGW